MGEINVLSGGVEILQEIKQSLEELDKLKSRAADLSDEKDKLEKLIEDTETAAENEIDITMKKRREEISATFDKEVVKTQNRMRAVKAKRDKRKTAQVSARIKNETAGFTDEKRELDQDLTAVFTKNRISRLFNNDYFFTMFLPGGFGDYLIIVLSAIIALALPAGIYFLIPGDDRKVWILVLLYLAIEAIIVSVYVLIYKKVRNRHLAALREARNIRKKIGRVDKRERETKKRIEKDKDESQYELHDYDDELAELDLQIDKILIEKKSALANLESKTREAIVRDINSRSAEKLAEYKESFDKAYKEQREIEAAINKANMEISAKYESYVGREVLSIPMIDSLIQIINTGDALNISDALVYYKKQQAEKAIQ